MADIVDENIKVLYRLLQGRLDDVDALNQQLSIVQKMTDEGSEVLLLDLLINRRIFREEPLAYLDGIIFQSLRYSSNQYIVNKLNSYFSDGLIHLKPSLKIDYQPLQDLLILQDFKQANKLMHTYLCQLAGLDANQRTWLYFTDISVLPVEDLRTLDMLWCVYSHGKFGFSVQRKIWLSNDCNWEKLWYKIGWKNNGIPCRYPDDFIWTLDAPRGHLPLFNQLRGVRVLSALFNHVIWVS